MSDLSLRNPHGTVTRADLLNFISVVEFMIDNSNHDALSGNNYIAEHRVSDAKSMLITLLNGK